MVQIMAWRRPGDKPLSEPMMGSLLTHTWHMRYSDDGLNRWWRIYASFGLNELKCAEYPHDNRRHPPFWGNGRVRPWETDNCHDADFVIIGDIGASLQPPVPPVTTNFALWQLVSFGVLNTKLGRTIPDNSLSLSVISGSVSSSSSSSSVLLPNRSTWYNLQSVYSSFLEGGRTEKHSLSSCPPKLFRIYSTDKSRMTPIALPLTFSKVIHYICRGQRSINKCPMNAYLTPSEQHFNT